MLLGFIGRETNESEDWFTENCLDCDSITGADTEVRGISQSPQPDHTGNKKSLWGQHVDSGRSIEENYSSPPQLLSEDPREDTVEQVGTRESGNSRTEIQIKSLSERGNFNVYNEISFIWIVFSQSLGETNSSAIKYKALLRYCVSYYATVLAISHFSRFKKHNFVWWVDGTYPCAFEEAIRNKSLGADWRKAHYGIGCKLVTHFLLFPLFISCEIETLKQYSNYEKHNLPDLIAFL